jgi:hypothetical protein
MWSFIKYYWHDEIKEDKIGGKCSTFRRCAHIFVEVLRGCDCFKYLSVDTRIILKCIVNRVEVLTEFI